MGLGHASMLTYSATVEHSLLRADGSVLRFAPDTRVIRRPLNYWRHMWERLRSYVPFFAGMSLACFIEFMTYRPEHGMQMMALWKNAGPLMFGVGGIVTQAGVNYLTTIGNVLSTFNYHSYGTGDVHGSTSTPTNATAATPIVVTQAGHPFFDHDIIKLTGITGITGINGIWEISYINSSSYSLLGSVGGGSSFGGGTNAAQLLNGQADTALTTEVSSITRASGTQTNPASNSYKSTVALTFTGTTPPLTIIEWGLFSAASSGTLWDRRWMNTGNAPSTIGAAALTAAPITITQTTDSINTAYTVTVTAGGS